MRFVKNLNPNDYDFFLNIEKKTGKVPKPIADEPIIEDWEYIYVNAFAFLHKKRKSGLSVPFPIELVELESYMRIFGIEDKEKFIIILSAMDSAYIEVAKDGHSKTGRSDRPVKSSRRTNKNP